MPSPEAAARPKRTDTTNTAPESDNDSFATPLGSEACDIEDENLNKLKLSDDEDNELIARAEVLYKEEKICKAAGLLRNLPSSLLSSFHHHILEVAKECDEAVSDLIGPPGEGSGWTKQGEKHGSRPTFIYNKLDEYNRLTSRVETPIEASLLVPLLSVFNETDLYEQWIPYSSMPKIGVQKSKKLEQSGRANQIIQLLIDVPWPLYTREAIIHALAVDDIDDQGCIIVRLKHLESGPVVPPQEPRTERLKFDGTILFRACPPDHELLENHEMETNEPLVLVSFKVKLISHVTGVPMSLINFVTRSLIGGIWGMFLYVAEGVRDGKRPQHKEAIEAKADFYRWIEQRTDAMLSEMKKQASSTLDAQELISYLQS